MKKTDHKAFVQLGLWKNPRWTCCVVLENYQDDTSLIEVCGNKIIVDNNKIKKHERIEYNFEKREFTELTNFMNNNWEELKLSIIDAMNKFFPDEEIKVDEDEKIIYALDNSLSISGGIFEIETISSFKEVAEWSIVGYKPLPSTRWEPEDVQEIDLGHSRNTIKATKIFIDNIFQIKCEGYWDDKNYETMMEEI